MKHSYLIKHAPFGCACSFDLGVHGQPGGFAENGDTVGQQSAAVGYRYPGERWTVLPYVSEAVLSVCAAGADALAPLPPARYGRSLGWATDRWMLQAMVFSIATPFIRADPTAVEPQVESASSTASVPALYALLDFDNSHMDDAVELLFAVEDDASAPFAPVALPSAGIHGWANADGFGFGTCASPSGAAPEGDLRVFSGCPRMRGLVFRIAGGGKAVFPVALSVGGTAQGGVDRTLVAALEHFDAAIAVARLRDDELRSASMPEEEKRDLAIATRAHLAGRPFSVDLQTPLTPTGLASALSPWSPAGLGA